MNKLQGKISEIKVSGALTLVTISLGEAIYLKSIVIETPETAPYLVPGKAISVIFKETEVILARGNDLKISIRNGIPGKIKTILKGEILCEIEIETQPGLITAIVSRDAVESLELQKGLIVTAMVKLNEVMLAE